MTPLFAGIRVHRERRLIWCLLLPLVLILALNSTLSRAETVDTLTVSGTGKNEKAAQNHCIESAVAKVMRRYVREKALKAKKQQIRYRVLDQSPRYLTSFTILSSRANENGTWEVTGEVQVSVDKLLTSLRNLEVEVLMWAPGPDQAIEGRRGTGSKTKPDRFKEED